MEQTYTIELTEGEMNAIGQLCDIAVQARGLAVAEAAVFITKKMAALLKAAKEAPLPVPAPANESKEGN
jgi:hypothetical protein